MNNMDIDFSPEPIAKTFVVKYTAEGENGSQKWERKSVLTFIEGKSKEEALAMAVSMIDFLISYGASIEQADEIFAEAMAIMKSGYEDIVEFENDMGVIPFPQKENNPISTSLNESIMNNKINSDSDNSENVDKFMKELQDSPEFLKKVFKTYLRSLYE